MNEYTEPIQSTPRQLSANGELTTLQEEPSQSDASRYIAQTTSGTGLAYCINLLINIDYFRNFSQIQPH